MIESFKKTITETFIALVPICSLVIILSLIFDITRYQLNSFLLSSILLIFGITLFTFGADTSMMTIGEKLGNKLISSKNVILILVVTFLIGIFITIAEPDLRVLASQITSISTTKLILFISLGVGLYLMISVLKILFKLSFNTILVFSYLMIFSLLFFVPNEFIPIAFDSSGVTTGPISVPFILALGIGFTSFRTDKNSNNDTFGLIGLCSLGPKLIMLILGTTFLGFNKFDTSIYEKDMSFLSELFITFKEVIISVSPIILVFLIIKVLTKSFDIKQTKKIIIGLTSTIIGLTLFLTGVNFGFMSEGFTLGRHLINSDAKYVLLIFVMIIGFLVVYAEPAIKILTDGVDGVTEGSIKKSVMKLTISLGVTLAILISVLRIYYGISFLYFIIPGSIVALLLTIISPKIFTAISFDTSGCVCGPLTATFILPLLIGAATSLDANIYKDAFGLLALISLSPLITVQILGIIFKFKTKIEIENNIDETIINYNWEELC